MLEEKRTLPHGLVLLWRFSWRNRWCLLRFFLTNKDGFRRRSDARGYFGRALNDGFEIDTHEPKHHVVCYMGHIVRSHMRRVEDLRTLISAAQQCVWI